MKLTESPFSRVVERLAKGMRYENGFSWVGLWKEMCSSAAFCELDLVWSIL